MVIIDSKISKLNAIMRRNLSADDYAKLCFQYGIDMEGSGDDFSFELTSDRMEIISEHSLAYLFSCLLRGKTHRNEAIASSKADITIEKTHRPFVNLLSVKLNEPVGDNIKELMALQDKLDRTIGRNRRMAAIGMFDLSELKFPLVYKEREKNAVSFVPLGQLEKRTFSEIMSDTNQGREYASLVKDKSIIWEQKDGKIFAMPPIINADFASISGKTTNILIDITGMEKGAVNSMTIALIFNMQFFGDVKVLKPEYKVKELDPLLKIKENEFSLSLEKIKNILGIELNISEVSEALKAFDYAVTKAKSDFKVKVPFYRQDVIHQVDIIDDILRFVGVDRIKEAPIRTPLIGERLPGARKIDSVRDVILGFGYQETELNVLTNEKIQFSKTLINPENYAPLVGIKSGEITMARANILPEMLRFVSNNLNKKFPQNLFDVGYVLEGSDGEIPFINRLKLCILSCGKDSNLTAVYGVVKKVLSDSFGIQDVKLAEPPKSHAFIKTFIHGRMGELHADGTNIGTIGEVHPEVLNNFGIELPVSACEIDLYKLI